MVRGHAIIVEVGRLHRICIHEFITKVHRYRLIFTLCDSCRTAEKMTQIGRVYCERLSLPCLRWGIVEP
jgi:hypothetical protein